MAWKRPGHDLFAKEVCFFLGLFLKIFVDVLRAEHFSRKSRTAPLKNHEIKQKQQQGNQKHDNKKNICFLNTSKTRKHLGFLPTRKNTKHKKN